MNTLIKSVASSFSVALLMTLMASTLSMAPAYSATTLDTNFTPEQRVKLSRLASRNRQTIDLDSYIDLDDKRDDAFDENNSDCGNVNIGNIENPRPGSNIQAPDVIIAGDVLVVADDC